MSLPLLQLGDSALPIGGFSHSWGLEAALERGLAASPAAAPEEWTRQLGSGHSVAPTEGVVLVAAFRAMRSGDTASIVRANRLLEVGLLPATLRQASRDMGDQLRRLAEPWPWAKPALPHLGGGPWHHAVVFGVLACAARPRMPSGPCRYTYHRGGGIPTA